MEFKDELYRLRRERGFSQEELAYKCGVSRQAVSKWENGTANPDLENLKLLCDVLHISIDELLGKEKEERIEVIYVYGFSKEYQSKLSFFGLPLLHINLGRGKSKDGSRRVAKGIIAIGNYAIGVLSIGLMSAGILSFGILSLGLLFSIGVLSLSYLALGALAIGYYAIGAMAIGMYSIGALSIGYVLSIGALSYAPTAIGPALSTFGDQVYYVSSGSNSCIYRSEDMQAIQSLIKGGSLPTLMEFILQNIRMCS